MPDDRYSSKKPTEDLPTEFHCNSEAVLSLVPRAVDRFLHPRILNQDADQLHRARLVLTFAGVLVTLAISYSALFCLMDSPIGAAILVVGAALVIICLGVFRRTGSLGIVGNLLAAGFLCVLTGLGCRLGGHGAHVLAWYVGVPVVALGIAGLRSGACWCLAATA